MSSLRALSSASAPRSGPPQLLVGPQLKRRERRTQLVRSEDEQIVARSNRLACDIVETRVLERGGDAARRRSRRGPIVGVVVAVARTAATKVNAPSVFSPTESGTQIAEERSSLFIRARSATLKPYRSSEEAVVSGMSRDWP